MGIKAFARSAVRFLLVLVPLQSTPAQPSQWQPLFNGKNLEGWSHVGEEKFIVENGLLKTVGGMGLLWYTQGQFGNCTNRVVYKTTAKTSNSGVFIRIPEKPTEPWMPVHRGYEVFCD
jgi:hypothetical protein